MILKQYLGLRYFPFSLDIRKREIMNDNIDIEQWRININYLIQSHGTIDPGEWKAFNHWIECLEEVVKNETGFINYLEDHATPVLLRISPWDIPPILQRDKDRNWFLAAYPDVLEYFYPQMNVFADDFDKEKRRLDSHLESVESDCKRMEKYLATGGKANQTIYLMRMKDFYRNELNKSFLLGR